MSGAVLLMMALLGLSLPQAPLGAESEPAPLTGTVVDGRGEPVFAANVYFAAAPAGGTVTDPAGRFSLARVVGDTLVVSFLGYQPRRLPGAAAAEGPLTVVLREQAASLAEVTVRAADPISEQFAVAKMDMLEDVYLNPVAQGDPLKAITVLPASTTVDESAGVSLRGSSADRSRVVLNGVPIYNPVRAGSLNNQGFFSVFNPALIRRQYVYASNPPLTYGNTSAGLVEIQTAEQLPTSSLSLSAGLANAGGLWSQRLGKGRQTFVRAYGNYQFSGAFVGIQPAKLPDIDRFEAADGGVHFRTRFGERAALSTFAYYLDERFAGTSASLAYQGPVGFRRRRTFVVNRLTLTLPRGALQLSQGGSYADSDLTFGNLESRNRVGNAYASLNYAWFPTSRAELQTGLTHDYQASAFRDRLPVFFYALAPGAPSFRSDTSARQHLLEPYAYGRYRLTDRLDLSAGLRTNVPTGDQAHFLSGQLSLRYAPSRRHALLLSGGQYHSYTVPDQNQRGYALLSARQVALDYTLTGRRRTLQAAAYLKDERGAQPLDFLRTASATRIGGAEVYWEEDFGKYWKLMVANSWVDVRVASGDASFTGANSLAYFLKATVQYNNPRLFSAALTWLARPGRRYTPVVGAERGVPPGTFVPTFGDFNAAQYGAYRRLDLNVSRYFTLANGSVIVFASLNNLLDRRNERAERYAPNYREVFFEDYSRRTFYAGAVWQLNLSDGGGAFLKTR